MKISKVGIILRPSRLLRRFAPRNDRHCERSEATCLSRREPIQKIYWRRFVSVWIVLVVLSCLFAAGEASAVGQSAVVTLGFPIGARPTAMGEAFTGLANDANAVYYNPAGLGQSPLTISWKTFMSDSAFTAVAARASSAFGSRDYVWAGSNWGVARFNGKIWERGETYVVEEGESLRSVALRYFDVDRKDIIDNALWEIRRENNLGMKRYERLVTLLEPYASVFKANIDVTAPVPSESIQSPAPEPVEPVSESEPSDSVSDSDGELRGVLSADGIPRELADSISTRESETKSEPPVPSIPTNVSQQSFSVQDFARMLILLPPDESVSSNIADNLLPKSMDEQTRKDLADKITEILGSEDRSIADVTELLIPFTITVRDTVTAMVLDATERLWVGTVSGLWRHSNGRWRRFTAEAGDADGVLPSYRVTAVAVSPSGDVAVGTDNGLAIMKGSDWYVLTDKDGLPDSYITSVAFAGEKLYVGTNKGLAVKSGDNSVAVFDTSSGLLSLGVTALFADSKGRIWIGGDNGITIYTPSVRTWTRYKFPGSTVYAFAEQSGGVVWIGTNKGVITHKAGKTVIGKDGKPVNVPEWKTYHSKNALKSDNVSAITACGKDMWVATDAAMHQYAHAEKQVMLFYEQILPAFQMSDLWHGLPAVVIPTEDWGTLAFSMNFISMGDNEQWDDLEVYLGRAKSWEGVFGLSYGFPVKEDLSLGLSAKYVYSVLDSKAGGIGQTFAIDAAVLKRNFLVDKLDLGFMLQNMGPSIYYMTPEEADPIPFSLRLGLAYRPIRTPFHELSFVFDAYREVVKNYYDKGPDPFWTAIWTGMLHNDETTFAEELQEINVSLGMEYLYADFMALRLGFLGDYLGERFELSMGLGVKYANVNFDFSYIYSPPGFMSGLVRAIDKNKEGSSGVRDGQWRLSFLFGL